MRRLSTRRWVAAWGNGDWGRLGTGDVRSRQAPTACVLEGDDKPVQVAAGGAHTLLLLSSGRVLGCGLNDCGQLGASGEDSSTLAPVAGLPEDVVSLAAGDLSTLAVTRNGELWACGGSSGGHQRLVPERVPIAAHVVAASAGARHWLALTDQGDLYSWGVRALTGLGDEAGWRHAEEDELLPRLVRSLRGVRIVAAAAGRAHSAVIDAQGGVWTFGDGRLSRQLGTKERSASEPVKLESLYHAASISCGGLHTLATTHSGQCYAWGGNEHGSLGVGSLARGAPSELPVQLRSVSAGWKHSLGVNTAGALYAWGWGGSAGSGESSSGGQLGLGDENDYWEPTRVPLPPGVSCVAASAGLNHSAGLFEMMADDDAAR